MKKEKKNRKKAETKRADHQKLLRETREDSAAWGEAEACPSCFTIIDKGTYWQFDETKSILRHSHPADLQDYLLQKNENHEDLSSDFLRSLLREITEQVDRDDLKKFLFVTQLMRMKFTFAALK